MPRTPSFPLISLLLLVAVGCQPGPRPGESQTLTTAAARHDEQARLLAGDGATAKLRLLETTDLHVNMEAFDYYRNVAVQDAGLVRTATLIRRARAEVANSLLLDNGDLIQGSPLGDWFKAERTPPADLHPVFKAMNLLGYDAANIGNHEFNYGLDFLEAALTGAKFPYVSANTVRANGQPLVAPYVILTRTIVADSGALEELKVGVIGFVPPQIMKWDRSNLLGRLDALDIVDTAAALVPRLRAEGADVIVAVPHSGISAAPRAGKDENAVYHLAQVPGIDAILSGHSHQVFPGPAYAALPESDMDRGTIHGVPTVMAGSWGSHLGVVDLELKKVDGRWAVTGGTGATREVKSLLQPDDFEADVRAAVAADHAATLDYLQQAVGTAERPIHSYFAQLGPSSAVQIVQEAQLWYGRQVVDASGDVALKALPLLSASAPLKAGGRPDNYTDVAAGPLTLRNVADLYVYPNTVKIVKITGAQLQDWLEMAAGAFNRIVADATEQWLVGGMPAYNFDQILGVDYEIDVTQPARFDGAGKLVDANARRIVNLTYQGAPLLPDQDVLVVTNNYRAGGGGSFPGLDGTQVVLDPGRESREALRDYVQTTGSVGGGLARHWRLKPVPGAANVLLRTSPRSLDRIDDAGSPVTYVETDGDGYARYRLNW